MFFLIISFYAAESIEHKLNRNTVGRNALVTFLKRNTINQHFPYFFLSEKESIPEEFFLEGVKVKKQTVQQKLKAFSDQFDWINLDGVSAKQSAFFIRFYKILVSWGVPPHRNLFLLFCREFFAGFEKSEISTEQFVNLNFNWPPFYKQYLQLTGEDPASQLKFKILPFFLKAKGIYYYYLIIDFLSVRFDQFLIQDVYLQSKLQSILSELEAQNDDYEINYIRKIKQLILKPCNTILE